jgi:hypothetical protein
LPDTTSVAWPRPRCGPLLRLRWAVHEKRSVAVSSNLHPAGLSAATIGNSHGARGWTFSEAQADEFINGNLLFMMFPYIRTSIQQVSADLRLPLTVLPYLRRGPAVPSEDADARK